MSDRGEPGADRDATVAGTPIRADGLETSSPVLAQRYQLLTLLGTGGMGTVYRARDGMLDEVVALKVLRRDLARSPAALERFRREAKLARKVTHKNIARMFDLGDDRGERFLTMEYIEGDPLSAIAQSGPVPAEDVIAIALQVCDGLAASHEANVVHGDLKPANVLYTRAGRIAITDFGIARALTPDPDDPFAGEGIVSGTPGYMAPEQVSGRADLDGRADLYALGCMLYRLLTGVAPWKGSTLIAVASARLLGPPPDPREHVSMPDGLANVVLRCMAREREDRFPTAAAVAAALGGPTAARTWAPSDAPTTTTTIAVLPFENLGPAADSYLAEGFAAELADVLCTYPSLRVMPCRSPSARASDPRSLGLSLGVAIVVHGSVIRRGQVLDVVVRVLAVGDGFQLHAHREETRLSEIMGHARRTATAVAATVASAEPPSVTALSASPEAEAVDLYMQGRAIYTKQYYAAEKAMNLLERAHTLAPRDGRIGAAYALAMMRHFHIAGLDISYLERGRDVSLEALANHRTSAAAHTALALVHFEEGEFRSATAELRRALDLDPMHIDALIWKGRTLLEAGLTERAIEVLHTARLLDRTFELADTLMARAYADLGDFDAVDATLASRDFPHEDSTLRWRLRARFAAWAKRPAIAPMLVELEADTRLSDHAKSMTRWMLLAARDGVWKDDELDMVMGSMPQAATPRATGLRAQLMTEVLMKTGAGERALELLPELESNGLFDLGWLDHCPLLEALRTTPQFQALRRSTAARVARALEGFDDDRAVDSL